MGWIKNNKTFIKASDEYCATVERSEKGEWHYSLTFAGDANSKAKAKKIVDDILHTLDVVDMEEAESWKQE